MLTEPSARMLTEEHSNIVKQAKQWAVGRIWWIRLPLLMAMAYIAYRHLQDDKYHSIIAGLNLGIHEMGHLLFTFSTEFLLVAGGTFLQLFVPLVTIFMFYRQRDFFAVSFAVFWLGTNFFHIAPYVADARAQVLPLVSYAGGGTANHDWYYLLRKLDILGKDILISKWVYAAGVGCMIISLAMGTWVLWQMIIQKKKEHSGSISTRLITKN